MTTMTASAREGQPTGDCYWYIDGSTKTLTISGNGAMDDYAEATETPWYAQRKDIQKVIVEEGVTNIGDRAFHSLENLSFVNIAQTVQTIGKYAFRGCHSLEFVTIPAAVTVIDLDAFYQCTSIKDVFMYADPTALTWKDTDCDDFMGLKKTVCHVSGDAEAWTSAFGKTINITFVADGVIAPTVSDTYYNLTTGDNAHGSVVFYAPSANATKAAGSSAVIVEVTPDEGYIVDHITAKIFGTWEQAKSRRALIPAGTVELPIVQDIDFKKLQENSWRFTMPEGDVVLNVVYRKLLTSATISEITEQQYSGEALEPAVTVTDGTTQLVQDIDYTVSYEDNTNSGNGTVRVKGIGNYTGEISRTFTITPKSTDDLTVEVAEEAKAGEVPAILVKDGEKTLQEGQDYTISYKDGDGNDVTKDDMAKGGDFKAVITFKNYSGSIDKPISVTPQETTGIAALSQEKAATVYDLQGRRIKGNAKGVVIKDGKKTLVK